MEETINRFSKILKDKFNIETHFWNKESELYGLDNFKKTSSLKFNYLLNKMEEVTETDLNDLLSYSKLSDKKIKSLNIIKKEKSVYLGVY